ncbi:MAG: hypothetical protein WA005_14320, partial [Candidatus Binataceae bacterium]
ATPQASRANSERAKTGFAPPDADLFTPVVELAPAGPNRTARAVALLDKQLVFQRKISFHPKLDPALQQVVDKLPPRQSTLIRAAALYSRHDIAWTEPSPGVHQISVAGTPGGANYFYSLAASFHSPERVGDFSGMFALKPAEGAADGKLSSVIAQLGGELSVDTYGLGALIDAAAAIEREVYGTLKPPWDSKPGVFNDHDRAMIARFRRDLPALAAKLDDYLEIDNVLDEFSDSKSPYVLYNFDGRVREDSLRPFPHLHAFYHRLASQVFAENIVDDSHGHRWLYAAFDHGRIRAIFMLRGGKLTPFDSHLAPAGEPVEFEKIARGSYHSIAAVRVTRLEMDFGLDKLSFTTDYNRDGERVSFRTRMDAVPNVIAPPVVHQVILMLAGEFMRVLASGNSGDGLQATLSSRRAQEATVRFFGSVSAECRYSPALGVLARVGDAMAEAHNEQVRAEERQLGEELFDAFAADYARAKPAILALDHRADASQ